MRLRTSLLGTFRYVEPRKGTERRRVPTTWGLKHHVYHRVRKIDVCLWATDVSKHWRREANNGFVRDANENFHWLLWGGENIFDISLAKHDRAWRTSAENSHYLYDDSRRTREVSFSRFHTALTTTLGDGTADLLRFKCPDSISGRIRDYKHERKYTPLSAWRLSIQTARSG